MKDIKIREVPEEIVIKLDKLKGSMSRNEFLKQELSEIAKRNEVSEVETKYNELLNMTLKVIEKNTEVLNKLLSFDENMEVSEDADDKEYWNCSKSS